MSKSRFLSSPKQKQGFLRGFINLSWCSFALQY